jgi:hypothetical protein
MDELNQLLEWAWARHHNMYSWYIRPLFILPFCYFAWRRSLIGIAVTLVATLTSIAWFRRRRHLAQTLCATLLSSDTG